MNNPQFIDPEKFEDPLQNFEPPVYESELERAVCENEVSSLTPPTPRTISGDETVETAIRLLHEANLSSLVVTDGDQLVGIFTDRDVLERVSEHYDKLKYQPIRSIMTSDPMVVYEDDPIGAAIAAVAVAGYRHVPMLSTDGKVSGIVEPRCLFEFINTNA